jgi:isoleucyl-tRNA synthetase
MGNDAPYLPGWDCHGLPIEINVDKQLGTRKAKMSTVAIRRECRKYAEKYVERQRQGFKRLEVFGEWSQPYLTMSHQYEAEIARALGEFVEKGLVYKGQKPVHWCFSCKRPKRKSSMKIIRVHPLCGISDGIDLRISIPLAEKTGRL